MGGTPQAESSPLPRAYEPKTIHPLHRPEIISTDAPPCSRSCIHDNPFPSGPRKQVVERTLPVIEVIAPAGQDIGIHIKAGDSPKEPDFFVMGASARPERSRFDYHQVDPSPPAL